MAGLGLAKPPARKPENEEENWVIALEDEMRGSGRNGDPFENPFPNEVDDAFFRKYQARMRRAYDEGVQQGQRDRQQHERRYGQPSYPTAGRR